MRIFFTIMLVHLYLMTGAQTGQYHSFPEANAQWNVSSQACCATNCPGPPFPNPVFIDYEYSYFISGDTVINALTYNKIYRSGSSHEHCFFGSSVNNWYFENNDYFGGLRQDTANRTVFYIPEFGTSECLLYDFDLAVGDTLNGNCQWIPDCAVVSDIDSILVGNNYRKRFNLSGMASMYSLIEGIGSTAGLFEPLCPFEYSGNLSCFIENGQTMYPDTITACNNFTGLSVPEGRTHIKVFPNPFSAEFSVQITGPSSTGTWSVYDIQGRLVNQGTYSKNSFYVQRGDLNAGLYYFTVRDDIGIYNAVSLIAH